MILIVCPRCTCALRVVGDPQEVHTLVGPGSEFWADGFLCFRCNGEAHGLLESEVTFKTDIELVEVTPQQALAAINGFGTPPEVDFNRRSLDELLREKPIRRVAAKDIPGAVGRCVVEYLELWDGTRVHFASSKDGAVVFKITPPFSYADQVKT